MEILNPPRIGSLEPQTIQVVAHISHKKTEKHTLTGLFPFMTVYALKQRIALLYKDKKEWMPNQLFVAQESDNGEYKPLEFVWKFTDTLADPLTPALVGKPDVRIYDSEGRKHLSPTMFSGITLELADIGRDATVHVWSFTVAARATGLTRLTDAAFEGYLQLYYPAIESLMEATDMMNPLTKEDKAVFEAADKYRDAVDSRTTRIESLLTSVKTGDVVLRELHHADFVLPVQPHFGKGLLELRFYEMTPSAAAPFIRFFSASDRVAPLVKLATASGMPVIRNKKVLDMLMLDQPSTKSGAVILMKLPLASGPEGAAWTLRIYEDKSAELYIGAPRKDQPLSYKVMEEAVRLLPAFLKNFSADKLTLVNLNAVYEFKTALATGVPSIDELNARLETFSAFFAKEPVPKGDAAALSLHYKAVSNFVKDADPIMNFITALFLKSEKEGEDLPAELVEAAVEEEFGISDEKSAAYVQKWLKRRSDYVSIKKEVAPAVSFGSIVNVYNSHPKYLFHVINVESAKDLNRIISLLALMTSVKSEDLRVGAPVPIPIPVAAEEEEEEEEEEEVELDAELLAMFEHMKVAEEEPESESEPEPEPKKPKQEPEKPAANKIHYPPKVLKEWHIKQLYEHDEELFSYKEGKDKRVLLYTRACQSAQNKQPNVLSPDKYKEARSLYKSKVFWVEAPLQGEELRISEFVAKSPGEREKVYIKETKPDEKGKRKPVKSVAEKKAELTKIANELIALEMKGLRMGFGLGSDKSIVTLKDYASVVSAETKEEIDTLIKEQKSKPLWIVTRLGTRMDNPNFYICAEMWCIRDGLPLIPEMFQGTVAMDETTKLSNRCPICGGAEIKNVENPLPGQTVLRRGPIKAGEQTAKYAGIRKKLIHPDNFAVPCCFTQPNELELPEKAREVPNPINIGEEKEKEKPKPKDATPAPAPVPDADAEVNKSRPFSPMSTKGGAKNRWYIPTQNVLGRNTLNWFQLEKGAVAVPPPNVNRLLGQDPEVFLTKIKGVLGGAINSYLATPAFAFVRYGLDSGTPGDMFLSLMAFAEYSVNNLLDPAAAKNAIRSNADILAMMTTEKEYEMSRAFIQANHGTLVHEFSRPDILAGDENPSGFETWWSHVGNADPKKAADQRFYGKNVYLAWQNFKNYLSDMNEPKNLRYFESLFATPQLLTKTGFIIVRIRHPKNSDESPIIECPEFGISQIYSANPPPFLFILEDSVSGIYDALVIYDGVSKDVRKLYGVLQLEMADTETMTPVLREALQAFVSQYVSPREGCGVGTELVHPWVPKLDTTTMPRLSDVLSVYGRTTRDERGRPEGHVSALLRDRSSRLVGVIVSKEKDKDKDIFIPCLDDGTIAWHIPCLFGEDVLPRPDLETLLDVYMGRTAAAGKKKAAHFFKGLTPRNLVGSAKEITAVDLMCGATVPVKSFPTGNKLSHKLFETMKKTFIPVDIKTDRPWDIDARVIAYPPVGVDTMPQTSEEILEESYQHVRITVSNWLNDTVMGHKVKKQIELLRQARKRLPLYELQKRLDVLLLPVVSDVLTEEESSVVLPFVHRLGYLQYDGSNSCYVDSTFTTLFFRDIDWVRTHILNKTVTSPEAVAIQDALKDLYTTIHTGGTKETCRNLRKLFKAYDDAHPPRMSPKEWVGTQQDPSDVFNLLIRVFDIPDDVAWQIHSDTEDRTEVRPFAMQLDAGELKSMKELKFNDILPVQTESFDREGYGKYTKTSTLVKADFFVVNISRNYMNTKVKTPVTPLESLLSLECISIIIHHGASAIGGHYTAMLKADDGTWYHYDDLSTAYDPIGSWNDMLAWNKGFVRKNMTNVVYAKPQPPKPVTTRTKTTTRSYILRRDCTQIKKDSECTGGCSFSSGRCLIHTTRTERYVNPATVLTARLTDELLRTFGEAMEILDQRVPLLRTLRPDTMIKTDGAVLFSAEGRGDEFMYEKLGYLGRKPGTYTRGYVYPEEVGFGGDLLPADWAETLQVAVFGADISRDRYGRMIAAIVGITGKPIATLEEKLGEKFRGQPAQWERVAAILGVHVIETEIDRVTRQLRVADVYDAGKESANYVILDELGIPLQKKSNLKFVVGEKDLPVSVKAALEF